MTAVAGQPKKSRTRRALRWTLEVIGIALLAAVGGCVGILLGIYLYFKFWW